MLQLSEANSTLVFVFVFTDPCTCKYLGGDASLRLHRSVGKIYMNLDTETKSVCVSFLDLLFYCYEAGHAFSDTVLQRMVQGGGGGVHVSNRDISMNGDGMGWMGMGSSSTLLDLCVVCV